MLPCEGFMLITLLLVLYMSKCIPQLTINLNEQHTKIVFPYFKSIPSLR